MKIKKTFLFIILFFILKCNGQVYMSGLTIGPDGDGLYWGPTILFSAINTTTTAFNIYRIKNPNKPDKYKSNAIFAIISGSIQTALGIGIVSEKNKNLYIPASLNIAIGSSTIVTSILRLARKTPKETKLTYNFYYSPPINCNKSIIGLSLIRRLN